MHSESHSTVEASAAKNRAFPQACGEGSRPQRAAVTAKEMPCMRLSLVHSGHSINISSLFELLQQWLYSTLETYYLLSLTLFSWVWKLYLLVIRLPASRSCLQIEWLSLRPEATCHMLPPPLWCPAYKISAAVVRSSPEDTCSADIMRKRWKTGRVTVGSPPTSSGFLAELHPLLCHGCPSPPPPNGSRKPPLSRPALSPTAEARVSFWRP